MMLIFQIIKKKDLLKLPEKCPYKRSFLFVFPTNTFNFVTVFSNISIAFS